LEVAIVSTAPLPSRRLALLDSAFEESDLPIKVDVVDWQSISSAFRKRIRERHEIIYRPADPLRAGSTPSVSSSRRSDSKNR